MIQTPLKQIRKKYDVLHLMSNKIQRNKERYKYAIKRNEIV